MADETRRRSAYVEAERQRKKASKKKKTFLGISLSQSKPAKKKQAAHTDKQKEPVRKRPAEEETVRETAKAESLSEGRDIAANERPNRRKTAPERRVSEEVSSASEKKTAERKASDKKRSAEKEMPRASADVGRSVSRPDGENKKARSGNKKETAQDHEPKENNIRHGEHSELPPIVRDRRTESQIERPADRKADTAAERSVGRKAETAAERPVGRKAETAEERPAGRKAETAEERPVGRKTETAAERPADKKNEAAGEKADSKRSLKTTGGLRKNNADSVHNESKASMTPEEKKDYYKINTKPAKKNKKRSKPFSVFLTFLLMIGIMVGFAVSGALIGGYVAIIRSIPDMGIVGIKPGAYTSVIYDNDNNELSKLHGDENREYVTLDQIPKNMQQAVIAIEDERFYEHDGVDIQGFARAVYSTLTGHQLQGGSTITQQLIKNNITKVTRNTIKTKLKEQYLALKYEKELQEQYGSKEDAKNYILELYLNTIGLGHGYNGIKTAAEGYFGKEPSQLTLAECACLAGITNNPSLYSPRSNPEGNKKRQLIILNYMLEQGRITQEEYNTAINEDIYSKIKKTDNGTSDDAESENIHSYYEDALINQISEDLQTRYNWSVQEANNVIYNGGLQIYSNLDKRIQGIVDQEYNDDSNFPWVAYSVGIDYRVSVEDSNTGEQKHTQYNKIARSQEGAEGWVAEKKAEIEASLPANQKIVADKAYYTKQPQSAMAIIDYHTGEIKAIAGGRGEKTVNRAFNRATDSARQPGSVFKILAAYAPALDMGKISNATTIVDEPYKTADGYAPSNWWGSSYRGPVSIRQGIKDSMNIIAVKVMVETGIDLCYDYLLNFGFTTLENDNHAATALGGLTNGVTQVEVAAAYGTIANNGQYLKPYFYDKVLDHDGNLLLENTHESKQVLKPSTGYILTDLMTSVVKNGTGTQARLSNMPLAGKTGTTTDSKDLTFVGYTPYYVASIWLGYDHYDDTVKNMNNINQSVHLRMWRNIMEQVHKGLEVKQFTKPEGVEKIKVCKISGKKANSRMGCPSVTDYFDTASVGDYCTSHKGYKGGYFASSSGYSGTYDSDSSSSSSSTKKKSSSSSDKNSAGSSYTPPAQTDTKTEETPAQETPTAETPGADTNVIQDIPADTSTPAAPAAPSEPAAPAAPAAPSEPAAPEAAPAADSSGSEPAA